MFSKKARLFLAITFILTYCSWFSVAILTKQESLTPQLFALYVFGGFGPTFAAILTLRFWGDKSEFRDFLKQIIRVKVHVGWYLYMLIMPSALTFLPWLVNSATTGKQQLIMLQPFYMLLAMIPFMVIGGGLEELGWRGVLLPELLKRHGLLTSTLLVTFFWILWHIPLWFIKGVSQYNSNFVEFALSVIGTSLLLSVLYIKTKSIFLCIMFHSLMNAYMSVFSTPCLSTSSLVVSISTKLLICISIFIAFSGFKKDAEHAREG